MLFYGTSRAGRKQKEGLTWDYYQRNLTTFNMKDYIELYREAYDREFLAEGDKDIRRNFWKTARIDINRAKRTGLIKEACLDDYLEANKRSYSEISDETRSIIEQSSIIPAKLLSDHFKISISAVRQIRANHKNK